MEWNVFIAGWSFSEIYFWRPRPLFVFGFYDYSPDIGLFPILFVKTAVKSVADIPESGLEFFSVFGV